MGKKSAFLLSCSTFHLTGGLVPGKLRNEGFVFVPMKKEEDTAVSVLSAVD